MFIPITPGLPKPASAAYLTERPSVNQNALNGPQPNTRVGSIVPRGSLDDQSTTDEDTAPGHGEDEEKRF